MRIDRRSFLSTSAMTVVSGVSLASLAAPAEPAPKPRARLAIATYSYWHFRDPKVRVESVIDKAALLGVEGVDVLHRQMDSEDPAYVRRLKRHALSRGVALV